MLNTTIIIDIGEELKTVGAACYILVVNLFLITSSHFSL